MGHHITPEHPLLALPVPHESACTCTAHAHTEITVVQLGKADVCIIIGRAGR